MKAQNNNLVHLVKLLNAGEYIDGDALGKKLRITRSAVWKAIKKLRSYGINITSIKGKGYALVEELILYEPSLILQKLTLSKDLVSTLDLKIFSSIASTHEYLKTISFQKKIAVCLAEEQTNGRGRFARQWYSPFGQNVYMSLAWSLSRDISSMMGVSLVIGLAVLNAIKEYGIPEKFAIKWPNDILWENKKVAGILIDASAEINGNSKLIISVGLNLNMIADDVTKELQSWTSIKKITGNTVDKNVMVALLINNIIIYMQRFLSQGMGVFLEQWNACDYLLGKPITIGSGNTMESGICKGIDKQGQLRLELADSTCKVFSYGDTTIFKI